MPCMCVYIPHRKTIIYNCFNQLEYSINTYKSLNCDNYCFNLIFHHNLRILLILLRYFNSNYILKFLYFIQVLE